MGRGDLDGVDVAVSVSISRGAFATLSSASGEELGLKEEFECGG
jgi:hypothetical protein